MFPAEETVGAGAMKWVRGSVRKQDEPGVPGEVRVWEGLGDAGADGKPSRGTVLPECSSGQLVCRSASPSVI